MVADWNGPRLAPASYELAEGRRRGQGEPHTKKREPVPSSRIRNQAPQFAQLEAKIRLEGT